MTILHLTGRVTDKHELEVELPPEVPAGEVRIIVEIPLPDEGYSGELDDSLRIEPMTGAEIIEGGFAGGWTDQTIQDGQLWLDESRQRRRAARRR